jgi:hypothetical protein
MDEKKDKAYLYYEEKDKKYKKYLFPLIAVFIFFLGLLAALYLLKRETQTRSKAYTYTEEAPEIPATKDVNIENSYVFASPLRAKKGGELIRVTVFALDGSGFGVEDKKISFGVNEKLKVDELEKTTDDEGKVYFDVSSNDSGVYLIEPSIEGKSLGKRVSITFE